MHQLTRAEALTALLAAGTAVATATTARLWRELRTARHHAAHDPMTGLPNAATMTARLQTLLNGQKPVAAIMVDLNGFKVINDTHGHLVGDRVLIAVAHTLARLNSATATVGRLHGDEFLIVADSGIYRARSLALAVRDLLASLNVTHWGQPIPVTASVGVAVADHNDVNNPDDLIGIADSAMYFAKRHSVYGGSRPPQRLTAVQTWQPGLLHLDAAAG